MKYLISGGGFNGDEQFHNIRAGNQITAKFALDNGCFSGHFDAKKFDKYLEKIANKKHLCLFLVMPDAVGDPVKTMDLWRRYYDKYKNWPLAFVAQDGQECLLYPPDNEWQCLFIGGSTHWKMSEAAKKCIQYAVDRGKHIHIGRVNSYRRFRHFACLPGGEGFTCDGTQQRFVGKEKAHENYRGFEKKYANSTGNNLFNGDYWS
jgi:hypothetical protein